jgi:putative ABC transport system ATP-binding protein
MVPSDNPMPPGETPAAIHARKLTRVYTVGAVEVRGVDGIDLSLADGALVVLKGDSGSGKSTLLSLLAGLDRLSTGELTVAGHDLNHCSEAELTDFRRNTVGMIFQAFNLLPTLTVLENVCLPATPGRSFPKTIRPKGEGTARLARPG